MNKIEKFIDTKDYKDIRFNLITSPQYQLKNNYDNCTKFCLKINNNEDCKVLCDNYNQYMTDQKRYNLLVFGLQ